MDFLSKWCVCVINLHQCHQLGPNDFRDVEKVDEVVELDKIKSSTKCKIE